MRAKTLNESNGGLKIYKYSDGTYGATMNSKLYSFFWNPITYKVYAFKKEGTINDKYTMNGKLISKPHIQMILQVQQNISNVNEGIEILRGKTEKEIKQSMFKGEGFYAIIVVFKDESWDIEFRPIFNAEGLEEFYNEYYDKFISHVQTFDLVKISPNHVSSMDYSKSTHVAYYGKTTGGIDHIIREFGKGYFNPTR